MGAETNEAKGRIASSPFGFTVEQIREFARERLAQLQNPDPAAHMQWSNETPEEAFAREEVCVRYYTTIMSVPSAAYAVLNELKQIYDEINVRSITLDDDQQVVNRTMGSAKRVEELQSPFAEVLYQQLWGVRVADRAVPLTAGWQ